MQQNPILNETDIDDIDDPIQKRIINTDNCSMLSEQLYHIFHTENYYDNKLPTELMENIANSTNKLEDQKIVIYLIIILHFIKKLRHLKISLYHQKHHYL